MVHNPGAILLQCATLMLLLQCIILVQFFCGASPVTKHLTPLPPTTAACAACPQLWQAGSGANQVSGAVIILVDLSSI